MTVSLGDTAISLHTHQHPHNSGWGEIVQTNSNPKCQDLSKFSFSGGGILQTNIPKILELATQGILYKIFAKPGSGSPNDDILFKYQLPACR